MILIKGGRVVDPKSGLDEMRDIVLEGEDIKYIGRFQETEEYEKVIDAEGMIIAPGLIDAHVHFRDPGFTYKEDIETGAKSAARGGFTTVVCMANTNPVIDNTETLKYVLEKGKSTSINIKAVGTVSKNLEGRELTDMKSLLEGGAVGFSDDGIPLMNAEFLHEAMLSVKKLNVPISLHEEDISLIGRQGINNGIVSNKLGFKGAPSVSESSIIARDTMLALDTRAKVHIQHLSAAESVEVIRLAKQMGAKLTAEVTPQHFSLTEYAVLENGTLAKVNPPLRTLKDKYALIEGLKDGTIDIIVTDHAPHSDEEKARSMKDAPSGMIGLETSLALGITNLVRKGHLTMMELLEKMTIAPAKLYDFNSGYLSEGGKADLVIFDDEEQWEVRDFSSKSSNSPFIGNTLFGKVKYTICNGEIVYSDTLV